MPIGMLPTQPERVWPADLDRLALLDMRGEWKPAERPKPITPPLAIKTSIEKQCDAREAQAEHIQREGMLQRQLAKVARLSDERGRKLTILGGQLRRRDARISALQEILRDERAELAKMRKHAKQVTDKAIAELQAGVLDRDNQILALKSRVGELQKEAQAAQKALGTIKLRAHDWLELREGKRVIREIRRQTGD